MPDSILHSQKLVVGCVRFDIFNQHKKSHTDAPFIRGVRQYEIVGLLRK